MDAVSPTDLGGLWVPVVTPFDAAGEVDRAALERLCARLLGDGARGIVALGTTGEPAVLSEAEQRAVIDVCSAVCAEIGRPLIVGAGTNSTAATIVAVERVGSIAGAGRGAAIAVLVVVPYYTRPSPAGVIAHYRAVAAASPLPVVAYNIPYRTGRGLDAAALLELAAIDNVMGVKQAVASLDADTLELLAGRPDSFTVLAGDDAFIAPTVLMGGSGAIAAAAHCCTGAFAALVDAARSAEVVAARGLAECLLPVVQAGFAEPNPTVWKGALAALGEIPTPNVRAPHLQASPGAVERLVSAVRRAGEAASQA